MKSRKRAVHVIPPSPKVKKTFWASKKIWIATGLILALIGAPLYVWNYRTWIKEETTTEKEKFKEDRWIRVPRISAKFYSGGPLFVNFIGMSSKYHDFEQSDKKFFRVDAVPKVTCGTDPDEESATQVYLEYLNNQFLVSLKLKDLKTGALLTKIENNVGVMDPSLSDYVFSGDGESYIEIIDQYDYVAFQMYVDENKFINIRGYFVGSSCVVFAYDSTHVTLDKSDKDFNTKLDQYASKLKPRFTSIKD